MASLHSLCLAAKNEGPLTKELHFHVSLLSALVFSGVCVKRWGKDSYWVKTVFYSEISLLRPPSMGLNLVPAFLLLAALNPTMPTSGWGAGAASTALCLSASCICQYTCLLLSPCVLPEGKPGLIALAPHSTRCLAAVHQLPLQVPVISVSLYITPFLRKKAESFTASLLACLEQCEK